MKKLPWIVGGVGVGLAAFVLVRRIAPGYADAGSDIDHASGKMSLWGWKARLKGKGTSLAGGLKEKTGHALNNEQLVAEGLGDKAVGAVENTAGHASQKVCEALQVMAR